MNLAPSSEVRVGGEITGRKVLFMMCAFFGVIIAVNLALTLFALSTETGLVVRNSYVASQDFNRMSAKAAAQEKLGWSLSARYQKGLLVIEGRTAEGQPLTGLSFAGTAGRPVADFQDQPLTFGEVGSGVYRSDVTLGTGTWQIDVTAVGPDNQTFRRIFRLKGGDSQ